MAEKLLPCPFCGYQSVGCEAICPAPDVLCDVTEEWKFTGICCPTCAVWLPVPEYASLDDGIAAWNRRNPTPAPSLGGIDERALRVAIDNFEDQTGGFGDHDNAIAVRGVISAYLAALSSAATEGE